HLAYSADGKKLASFSDADGMFRVWEARDGKLLWERRCEDVNQTAFFPSGQAVAVVCRNKPRLRVLEIPSGRELWSVTLPSKPANHFQFWKVAPSANGDIVAALVWNRDYSESRVHAWDARTGRKVVDAIAERFHDLSLFADGKTLATADGGVSITLWEIP